MSDDTQDDHPSAYLEELAEYQGVPIGTIQVDWTAVVKLHNDLYVEQISEGEATRAITGASRQPPLEHTLAATLADWLHWRVLTLKSAATAALIDRVETAATSGDPLPLDVQQEHLTLEQINQVALDRAHATAALLDEMDVRASAALGSDRPKLKRADNPTLQLRELTVLEYLAVAVFTGNAGAINAVSDWLKNARVKPGNKKNDWPTIIEQFGIRRRSAHATMPTKPWGEINQEIAEQLAKEFDVQPSTVLQRWKTRSQDGA